MRQRQLDHRIFQGADANRMNFKAPTRRNVELTYPYFHGGSAATPEAAVETTGKLQPARFLAGLECEDRRLPEDADRRPADARNADPAAVQQRDAAAETVRERVELRAFRVDPRVRRFRAASSFYGFGRRANPS